MVHRLFLQDSSCLRQLHSYHSINNVVYIADYQGEIFEEEYFSGSASISSSREATKAKENYNSLIAADGGSSSETTTNQDANALCQSNTDASGDFTTNGTSSCYIGRTFTFNDIILGAEDIPFDSSMISVTEVVNGGDHVPVTFSDARMGSDGLVITFNDDKIFNAGASLNEIRITNNISVQTNCTAKTTFTGPDYSKLAEKYNDENNVPRPSHWSGWILSPQSIEFWLDGDSRIHERLKYVNRNGQWIKSLLSP